MIFRIFKFSSTISAGQNTIYCDNCSKTFDNKQNLCWHLRKIHIIETSKSEQRNFIDTPFNCYSLVVIKNHVQRKHGTTKQKLCINATVSSLIQKFSRNTCKKFIRCLQSHKPKTQNGSYLKHLLSVVQCKRTS